MNANQLFKQRFEHWLRASIAIAAAFHFFLFAFWPTMAASDTAWDPEELEAITLPPEVIIPPPPEAIQRPAMPVVSAATMDEDITIAETTLESNQQLNLPAPPTKAADTENLALVPQWTPFDVKPRVLNHAAVVQSVERSYPSILRDAGIGGTVEVWFFLDVDGTILNTQLKQSSGQAGLDEAAMKVADIVKFSPARNRDRPVQVWVSQWITFHAR
jgi:TonB family protein